MIRLSRLLPAIVVLIVLAGCAPMGVSRSGVSGADLPFGEVASACGIMAASSAAEVDHFPKSGRPLWRLYDTDPGSTGPRTQYITGFRDGCARQITGALVLFGTPAVHEVTRYDPTNKAPYSATDLAYEPVKARICGVPRRVPCPSDRLDRLERRLTFVTIYPEFGSTGMRYELLLDQGALMAGAVLE